MAGWKAAKTANLSEWRSCGLEHRHEHELRHPRRGGLRGVLVKPWQMACSPETVPI